MLILVIGTLLLLAAIVGVGIPIGWFDTFPSEWEWFFGILSIAAFIMGGVVLPQLVWGKPKLQVEFHTEATEGERHLALMFYNRPLRNKVLRNLGIYRMSVQSLAVNFRMFEVGTNRLLFSNRSGLLKTDESLNDDDLASRVSLPPTFSVGAAAFLVRWDYEKKIAIVSPDRINQEVVLALGQYVAEILVFVDGFERRITGQFVVKEDASSLTWIDGLAKPVTL